MYINVFNHHSQLKQWSHEFSLGISFFRQNLAIRFLLIGSQYRSSPPEVFFWGSMLWVGSKFTAECQWIDVISMKLLMQLCGDHSSTWVFFCGLCFAFAEHFLGGHFFCLNIFLWKPFDHFLMTVLFYFHAKNILNLK